MPSPTILVAYATKHGSTKEIAEAISETLQQNGTQVIVSDVKDVANTDQFDAFVIGSAVYAGSWTASAKKFVKNHKGNITQKPTWLFSSGNIGNPPRPNEEGAVNIDDILAATKAKEHKLFKGNLDNKKLNLAERAIIRALNIQYGDFRDWDDIKAWSSRIAALLANK